MEIERTAVDYAKRIVELEAHRDELKEENVKLKAREVRMKEKFESEESKWREEEEEIRAKCWASEREKRKLEIDLGQKSKTAEAEATRLKRLLEEIQSKKPIVEKQKGEFEAEIRKLGNEKRIQDERIVELNDTLEVKTREYVESLNALTEASEKTSYLLDHAVEVFDKENRETIAAITRIVTDKVALEKKNWELVSRVEVLEREKKQVEEEACKGMRDALKDKDDKIEEMKRILKEQYGKKILQFASRVNDFEDLEAEKVALKVKNSELVARLDLMEAEKRRFETETRSKNGMIKALLLQQNEIKEMATNKCSVVNSEEDVELPHQMHPVTTNVGLLSNPTAKKQGPKSVDVFLNGPNKESVEADPLMRKQGPNSVDVLLNGPNKESVEAGPQMRKLNGKVSGLEHRRRKVEAPRCSVASQVGIKRSKSGLLWATPQTMLNALTENGELCMKSICALYRKHKSLGPWKKSSSTSSTSNNGFMPDYETRGMALGELLTSGDPEGRLKMSLGEFGRVEPRGPEDCRVLVRHHYLLLFEIYRNNLDPLFIPDREGWNLPEERTCNPTNKRPKGFGRPQKHEICSSLQVKKRKCSSCGEFGHNMKTCSHRQVKTRKEFYGV